MISLNLSPRSSKFLNISKLAEAGDRSITSFSHAFLYACETSSLKSLNMIISISEEYF